MKIVAINGSPKGENGNTNMLLSHLGVGIKKAQGTLDIINLKEYDVKPCIGCYYCWKKEGQCVHNDDIWVILHKLLSSDMIILATPVYCHNVSLLIKRFIDRFTFLMSDARFYQADDGTYRHIVKYKVPPFVVLSSCNLCEYSNFDIISLYFNNVAKHVSTEVIGEIYRTQTPVLKMDGIIQKIVSETYWETLSNAGYELATERTISKKTEINLKRSLVDSRFFADYVNENMENDVISLF